MQRLQSRNATAWVTMAVAATLAGCPDGGLEGGRRALGLAATSPPPASTMMSPSPTPPPGGGLGGGIGKGEPEITPTPTASATATGAPAASSSPSPSATPANFATGVFISPAMAVKLWLPPASGNPDPEAGYLTTAQLSASVTLLDGSVASNAIWSSPATGTVAIDQTGKVTAVGPGSGAGPWSIFVRAVSPDGLASALREVIVHSEGALGVAVPAPVPLSARTLDYTLLDGARTVATDSMAVGTGTRLIGNVPAGAYTLRIQARRADAGKTVAAEATASVSVAANRKGQASLAVKPLQPPRLTYIAPTSGPAGEVIKVYGQNLLPTPNASYDVLVDGVALRGSSISPGGSYWDVVLPGTLTGSASITIVVDGIPVPADQAQVYTVP